MDAEQGHRFFRSWLPLAREAGPFVTLLVVVAMIISTWWFAGWLRDCADRNRLLADKLVTQQETFQREVLLRLAHCPPTGAPR